MRYKVLDYLYKQGGLTLFAFTGGSDIPLDTLQDTALALNAGAGLVIVDFSGKAPFPSSKFFTADLLNGIIPQQELTSLKEAPCYISGKAFPRSDEQFRNLYHNLHQIQEIIPQIIGILPREISKEEASYIPLMTRLLIVAGSSQEDACSLLEDIPSLQATPLLWLYGNLPPKKRFPKAWKAVTNGYSLCKECKELSENNSWEKRPQALGQAIEMLQRIRILEKNPLDGIPKLFKKLFPLFLLIAVAIPFLFISKLEPSVSNARNRNHERDVITTAPSFEYTFDGRETLNRIARYSIGRFKAIVANEKMVKEYMDVTLDENGFSNNAWVNENPIYPPAGTVIKFSRPEMIPDASTDSIGSAWKYWTSIYSDSIAYLTEFYHEHQTAEFRKHQAIDVAGKQGARILAPFSAKAWTSRDERGGIIIGLVHDKQVIIFMHCDQLLYLDGQEVMAGDPIATVGISGHTTGPHAHIVTGVVDKNGTKRIGNVRYNVMDPIAWYYRFKPNSLK